MPENCVVPRDLLERLADCAHDDYDSPTAEAEARALLAQSFPTEAQVEVVARATFESENGEGSWRFLPNVLHKARCAYTAAGLRALLGEGA